jgi:hypothetical protein
MKSFWFTRKGFTFLPASVIGWIIFISVLLYAVYNFIEIDNGSHSVSDTLMNFVFNLFLIWIVYSIIGFFTSKPKTEK